MIIDFKNPSAQQVQSTISIIKKFTGSVTCLEIREYTLTMSDFLEILSLVPNAEILRIHYLRTGRWILQKKRRIMTSNKNLNLHLLKILDISNCDNEFSLVFNRLPAEVLSELECSYFPDEWHALLKRQTNIKKLCLSNVHVAADLFDNMNLETLIWECRNYNNVATILSKQTKLKTLDLDNYDSVIDVGVMNAVANHLTELESLSMTIDEVPAAPFVSLIKLEKLQNLTLRWGTLTTELFNKLDVKRITTLTLDNITFSADFIESLAEFAQNLKALQVNGDMNWGILNKILSRVNFVDVLVIENILLFDEEDEGPDYIIHSDWFNSKLIELHILFVRPFSLHLQTELTFLEKLVTDYPNLKKFTIHVSTPLTASLFKTFLNGFTKMEYLAMFFDNTELTNDDFLLLKNQKNLKFFYYNDFQQTAELKIVLRAIFPVVNVFEFGFAVAINRSTMKRQITLMENLSLEL